VADMVVDFDPNLPDVPCFIGDINQVILNIMVNAAHAIGDLVAAGKLSKGTITVQTRHVDDAVEIRIKDTGGGIPDAIQNKIFDPFFTTKAVGRGTGQGLAIAHGVVVEKHGGTISFETEIGCGSTFIIRLPLVPSLSETT
jgi:signal transduction histidine kinase